MVAGHRGSRHDQPVNLTGWSPSSATVARLGPVYTPAGERGRGYGAAAVARLTHTLLVAGHRVVLFADADNPVANRLYERLGFRAIADEAALRIVDRT